MDKDMTAGVWTRQSRWTDEHCWQGGGRYFREDITWILQKEWLFSGMEIGKKYGNDHILATWNLGCI